MNKPQIRRASLEDAALAADLMTAAYPVEPEDPVMTADRWANDREDYTYGRFIAELDGTPVAYLGWAHGPWEKLPERHCYVDVYLDAAHMDDELLRYLWSWIQDEVAKEGAWTLNAFASDEETHMKEVLEELGFERDREDRVWDLNLETHGARLSGEAAEARKQMEEQGIRLTTISDWIDPRRFEKLHRLNNQTRQDIPSSTPILDQSLEYFMARINAPGHRPDRIWIALDGDEPVAMSLLSFPPVRGNVWTGYTCCARPYRGRGIARAVKLQTLAQAIDLGVTHVRTDNDFENAPMLHINEKLGYESLPGYVGFVKRLPATSLR